MKIQRPFVVGLCLVAGLSRPLLGAEEEQIVIEDLSLTELRAEIEKIQNEMYRVFNQLNEDDDYDIVCHSYTPTGSNITQRACEPQFMIERRGRNASDYQSGTDDLLTSEGLMAELQPEFNQLTEKMNAVAAESRYFVELNQILGMLRQRLQEIE